MIARADAIPPEIVELIRQTVREGMGSFGLKAVDVRAGEDHDGDPVIFIEASYDYSETPIDTVPVTVGLVSILRDRLWKEGETRFPHIRHKFDERQQVVHRRRARA
jgi:hypothetical protein